MESSDLDLRKLSHLKRYRDERDLRLHKGFSQNFLVDRNIIERFLTAAHIHPGENILEIGPGLGAITRTLLEKRAHVTAVEKDPRMVKELRTLLSSFTHFQVIEGDILQFPLSHSAKVVSSIPYQITSPLLGYLADHSTDVVEAHLILQKDVADRMEAVSGSRENNALALFCHYHFTMQRIMNIEKGAFFPQPKVASSAISLFPRQKKPLSPNEEKPFFALVRQAFQQKRKMLRRSLKNHTGISQTLKSLNVPDTTRPEQLSLEEFLHLFHCLYNTSSEEVDAPSYHTPTDDQSQ